MPKRIHPETPEVKLRFPTDTGAGEDWFRVGDALDLDVTCRLELPTGEATFHQKVKVEVVAIDA